MMNLEQDKITPAFAEIYKSDIEIIIAKRHFNGADLWATPDKRIYKGSPFSTLESIFMLTELMPASDPLIQDAAELIFSLWRKDGRFQVAPQTAIYPCHTSGVARVLCRLGYSNDERLKLTFNHLLDIQHYDGGWRCNSYKFGRGPETEFSNPGTTLSVLDAFRFTPYLNNDRRLDRAVESLLDHWLTRKPLGPCHYGIGALFMQVEFPLFRYNLFSYVYILSFYDKAKKDARFIEALNILKSKTKDGKIIIENPNRKIANLSFCKKGEPSEVATLRYNEILNNLR